MHEPVEHTEIPIGSERSFAVVFTIVFTLVALRPLLDDGDIRRWAILVAVVILLLGIAVPHVFVVPNRLWCRLGIALGSVPSQVVIIALFFLVLTPTGLAM
ncbi:MAG: SxtJ family membrane protein, partial [Acidimicrobiales bacterium]|nr:SxtJ family membrane protein [Acidimicrobiales bacterium]